MSDDKYTVLREWMASLDALKEAKREYDDAAKRHSAAERAVKDAREKASKVLTAFEATIVDGKVVARDSYGALIVKTLV